MSFNVELIKKSYAKVKPQKEVLINRFYEELYKLHPEARQAFAKSSAPRPLIAAIANIVEYLDEATQSATYLQHIGERHLNKDTPDQHYVWVGEALVSTLEHFYANHWNQELEKNWIGAYSFVANELRKGLNQQPKAKKPAPQPQAPKQQKSDLEKLSEQIVRELLAKSLISGTQDPVFREVIRDTVSEMLNEMVMSEANKVLSVIRSSR